ncbi:MAG: alkaline phosphatase family protein [Candidatus Thermoplasmatota archaeon]|nr:alkaline phosphatase family protein [Candidatus Thermoplasmatota archaeon]
MSVTYRPNMRRLSCFVVLLLLSSPLAGCTSPPDDTETASGCTSPDALNFNESAVTDDGSCEYPEPPEETPGCTYEGATNYDEAATVDDGSCEYPPDPVPGCTDTSALNFNATADTDDGSCRHIQPHVLMVLLDGWRPDVIAAAHTPTLDMMMQDSAYSMEARVEDTAISGSGHSSFLTGVHRDKHNVHGNSFGDANYQEYPYWFNLLKYERPEMHTAAYHNWLPMANTALDFSVCGYCVDMYVTGSDNSIATQLATDLANQQMDAVTIVIDAPDAAGHGYGFHPSIPQYVAAMNQSDAWLGMIMDAIFARTNYAEEDWMVIISSDHAGSGYGHGYNIPEHRKVPLIIWGAESLGPIWPAPDSVDIVPTALHHLGVEVRAEWGLDGRAVSFEPTGPPDAELGVNLVFNGDAELERGYWPSDQDASIPGWTDNGTLTTWIYGAPTYILMDDPGPSDRGLNYFGGGSGGDSSMHQDIDLSAIQSDIQSRSITYSLTAFIGGYSTQDDCMEILVEFFDSSGNLLLSGGIGPLYAEDRNNTTGIYLRGEIGEVPPSSAYVRVTLNAYLSYGYNDAYADNVSLILSTQ